ncbi:hypothetical protein ACFO1B_42715 [Dactylosporangium siamense]|uniref:hypothetical protein n=1 Tax=Dactylosporangium siamense TaxID=685454 RepID=UPI001944090E|nr:hypothetical protein [Dactylosporangium siamense]
MNPNDPDDPPCDQPYVGDNDVAAKFPAAGDDVVDANAYTVGDDEVSAAAATCCDATGSAVTLSASADTTFDSAVFTHPETGVCT